MWREQGGRAHHDHDLDVMTRLDDDHTLDGTAPAAHAAMPTLARGAALRFLLTRAYDWLNTPKDALVSPKNPIEYVRRLRFHQGVRSIAEYGLNGTGK